MAISRTQPMRPALSDALDEADALRTDLNAETEAREDADTALQEDIDATKDVIPFNSFSSVNTVKKYVDNTREVLPFNSFSAVNTVKKYVDDLGNAIKEVIPFADFDSTNTVKKYVDDLGTNILSLYRYGKYSATISANDSDAQTISFSSAFAAGKNVMLLSQIEDENSDLTITISNKTLSGFDISIINSSASPITFVFMYLAIGV